MVSVTLLNTAVVAREYPQTIYKQRGGAVFRWKLIYKTAAGPEALVSEPLS